jgi:hypothetical protein
MAADMCFAAAGRTWLSLYEVRAGAIPGGGGGPTSGRSRVQLTRVSAWTSRPGSNRKGGLSGWSIPRPRRSWIARAGPVRSGE